MKEQYKARGYSRRATQLFPYISFNISHLSCLVGADHHLDNATNWATTGFFAFIIEQVLCHPTSKSEGEHKIGQTT
jgi:hypothetical protein